MFTLVVQRKISDPSLFVLVIAIAFQACNTLEMAGDNSLLHFRRFTSYDRGGRLFTAETLDNHSINILKRVIIVIADLLTLDSEANYKNMTDAYFEQDNYNVFVVTRNKEAKVKYKVWVDGLAREVTDFIAALYRKTEPYLSIHLIGSRSGGQIASLSASNIFQEAKRKVGRVTLLNPEDDLILNKDEVEFIDVLHLDEGKPFGNVDFYVDGEDKCRGSSPSSNLDCIQLEAIEYFTQSIRSPDKFKAVKCESLKDFQDNKCDSRQTTVFGEHVDKNSTGKYYFLGGN